LQLSPQRICANQVAVQSLIPDFVAGWEYAMVSHDRRTSARRVAKVPAPGQGGKDDVLQSRTDESQGYLSKHKILAHDSGSSTATMFAAAARCWFILIARIPVE
jgi:hypothetical protein